MFSDVFAFLIKNEKIRLPFKDIKGKHTFNQFTIRVENRKKLENHLKKYKIPYGIYYPIPIYKQKAFKEFNYKYNLSNVNKITKECISIPIYPELNKNSFNKIVEVINKYK